MKAYKYIFIIISVVTIAGFIFYQNRYEPSPQQPSSEEPSLSETDKFLQKLDEIDRQKEW